MSEYNPILKTFYCHDMEAFERLKKELDEPRKWDEKEKEKPKSSIERGREKLKNFQFK